MASRANQRDKTSRASRSSGQENLSGELMLPGWRLMLLRAAIIVTAGLWIYSPAFHGDWLWDDTTYISENPLLKDPERLWKAWFQPGSFIEYYPLEQTVQWLQWQLWGNDTFGYHLTNDLLHITNALLVWRLLSKFGLRMAWLGGLIFAVHPIMVESVAWISELKNTLSLAPMLLAMCAWMDYDQNKRTPDYLWALGYFLMAMFCKISVAMFPFVILLYAWWKRERIGWSDLKAAMPFFIIALILGATSLESTAWFMQQRLESIVAVPIGGFFSHLALDGLTVSFYLFKCLWPVDLMPLYPQWKIDPPSLWQFLPWPVFICLFAWLWSQRRGMGRHIILGFGFFFINVAPLVGAAYSSYSWAMDHLVYLPIIGLIGLVTAGVEQIYHRSAPTTHAYVTGLITLVVALLAFHAHWYVPAFTGDEVLWNYELDQNPQAWPAHNNLGKILLQAGEGDLAREQFEAVIRLQPAMAAPYNNLGSALALLGRTPDAEQAFVQALKRDPNSPEANNNIGIVLAQTGHLPEAMLHFEQALYRHPLYAEAHSNLGNTLLQMGRIPDAIVQFEAAIQINPDYVAAYDNLGLALAQSGQIPRAVEQFQKALALDADDAKARDELTSLQSRQSSGKPK
jgi:Tfp pilus assembly protein PilF